MGEDNPAWTLTCCFLRLFSFFFPGSLLTPLSSSVPSDFFSFRLGSSDFLSLFLPCFGLLDFLLLRLRLLFFLSFLDSFPPSKASSFTPGLSVLGLSFGSSLVRWGASKILGGLDKSAGGTLGQLFAPSSRLWSPWTTSFLLPYVLLKAVLGSGRRLLP